MHLTWHLDRHRIVVDNFQVWTQTKKKNGQKDFVTKNCQTLLINFLIIEKKEFKNKFIASYRFRNLTFYVIQIFWEKPKHWITITRPYEAISNIDSAKSTLMSLRSLSAAIGVFIAPLIWRYIREHLAIWFQISPISITNRFLPVLFCVLYRT